MMILQSMRFQIVADEEDAAINRLLLQLINKNIQRGLMKICITSSGNSLESQTDQRFGRCGYFIIWDDTNNTFEAIANPNIDAGSGAGIQSAQLVVAKKVSAVITGQVGPKAEQVLQAAKLQIITGESGSVKDAIEKYKSEKTAG